MPQARFPSSAPEIIAFLYADHFLLKPFLPLFYFIIVPNAQYMQIAKIPITAYHLSKIMNFREY